MLGGKGQLASSYGLGRKVTYQYRVPRTAPFRHSSPSLAHDSGEGCDGGGGAFARPHFRHYTYTQRTSSGLHRVAGQEGTSATIPTLGAHRVAGTEWPVKRALCCSPSRYGLDQVNGRGARATWVYAAHAQLAGLPAVRRSTREPSRECSRILFCFAKSGLARDQCSAGRTAPLRRSSPSLALYSNLPTKGLHIVSICSPPFFVPASTFVRTCKSTVLSPHFWVKIAPFP